MILENKWPAVRSVPSVGLEMRGANPWQSEGGGRFPSLSLSSASARRFRLCLCLFLFDYGDKRVLLKF